MTDTIKTCEQDPIPTCLIKEHWVSVIPAMLDIVNTSITQGVVSSNLKNAIL